MERKPDNLIIVCCHGIWTGGPSAGADEAEWLIADFQRGETGIFSEHIRAGVRMLGEDRGNSVLAFSGAATRTETKLSEAQSYANLAKANQYWDLGDGTIAQHEFLIEDRALDSYHNVLFSLTLFWSTFRRWPGTLTIISHVFKKPRIVKGHCAAIGFLPLDRVRYPRIPGVVDDPVSLAGVARAEEEWTLDPHGRGESLAGKRARRNPWGTWQGVFPKSVDCTGAGLVVGGGIDGGEMLDPDAPRPFT